MKYAFVTGGSRGIGRAICLKLAEQGYHLVINYVANQAAAEQVQDLVRAQGMEAELLRFDVGNSQEVEQVLGTWLADNPDKRVEVLVNNAGIRHDGLLMLMTNEEWQQVMDASAGGFFNVTRLLIRNMIRQKSGRVINMVSLSGLKGQLGQTNYSAAKAAVIGATKALAQEVGRRGITVNAVAPGLIRTEMLQGLREEDYLPLIPMHRFGEPEEVANLVGFLASGQAAYISGQVISINGAQY
ncbi:3-oxoacyl-ACP reductase FabG [Hymenobacter sp. NST-14]|uniref:3-oxoacyl-ACP reductase FabG n=1 Tax=Hymenobacter piscis TaxID=2839984 RepID=UPI001C017ED9|nr:3-oxoacyl-ACP reductase FabG [Hymenobacter piscis]MBT9393143.1 3-oxoacyl-ACP reductase FabG [Hymenobacter piscis]